MKGLKTSAKSKRRALVTGGASGIGWAVVRRLRLAGTDVVIADLNPTQARRVTATGHSIAVRLDATDFEQVCAEVEKHGPFDILVNAAGIDQHAFFTQTTPTDWKALLAVNLEAVLNTTYAVLPAMQSAGYGRIVNIASEAGRLGSRGGSVYAAAKGGVIAFTRSIARENGPQGITANIVAPGPVDTPMLHRGIESKGEKLLLAMTEATLAKRLGTPDEVAAAVAFLASDIAGYITGEVLGVSGGMGCGA